MSTKLGVWHRFWDVSSVNCVVFGILLVLLQLLPIPNFASDCNPTNDSELWPRANHRGTFYLLPLGAVFKLVTECEVELVNICLKIPVYSARLCSEHSADSSDFLGDEKWTYVLS